ncbi:unnamed protein product [Amoebophrya sp. A25]|nr:unnamed protein product [Amoebophrya sp. A25]|eukprot:GSA25T00009603001.1
MTVLSKPVSPVEAAAFFLFDAREIPQVPTGEDASSPLLNLPSMTASSSSCSTSRRVQLHGKDTPRISLKVGNQTVVLSQLGSYTQVLAQQIACFFGDSTSSSAAQQQQQNEAAYYEARDGGVAEEENERTRCEETGGSSSSSSANNTANNMMIPAPFIAAAAALSWQQIIATIGLNAATFLHQAAQAAAGASAAGALSSSLGAASSIAALTGGLPICHLTLRNVTMACVPLVAPFNTPPVAYNNWCQNKRAVAFQRSLFFLCAAQGGLAMAKFFAGNLIGGFFDAMIAGTGLYAATPEGVTMLPTYLCFAGFNGVMDLLQLLQSFHGVMPLYLLPFQYAAFRPELLLLGCYFTYELHKELQAIFCGYQCAGPQDTLFVKAMSHDIWGSPPGCSEHEARRVEQGNGPSTLGSNTNTNWGSGTLGSALAGGQGAGAAGASGFSAEPQAPQPARRFSPFGGEGRRLGHEQEQ